MKVSSQMTQRSFHIEGLSSKNFCRLSYLDNAIELTFYDIWKELSVHSNNKYYLGHIYRNYYEFVFGEKIKHINFRSQNQPTKYSPFKFRFSFTYFKIEQFLSRVCSNLNFTYFRIEHFLIMCFSLFLRIPRSSPYIYLLSPKDCRIKIFKRLIQIPFIITLNSLFIRILYAIVWYKLD